MSIIRGAAISPVAAPERAEAGDPATGRVVRTLFYAVGIAAGIAYMARRSRIAGAPADLSATALARLEARLVRLEASLDGSVDPLPPVVLAPYDAGSGRVAHERRLAALERRITSVERTRESRNPLLFAKPNGTSGEDRRHG
jgi:hypothetical protein